MIILLWFLSSKCVEQTDAPVMIGPACPLVPYPDDDVDDVVILENPVVAPPVRKRRSHTMKEPVDE